MSMKKFGWLASTSLAGSAGLSVGLTRLGAGAALAALALASAPAAYAQETTSAIQGAVVSGGIPAANVAVTILHTPSGTRQQLSTNNEGRFDARGLRVGGPYTITVGSKSYNDIYIDLGKTFAFNADLAAADEISAVEVVSTATRSSDQGPRTVLNRDAIQSVVSVNRDIRDLARRDILVSQDLRARGGANEGGISIAGSNPRFNRITVDGVSANDTYGLAQGGLTTSRGPVTLDAVEQFVISAVPTDVENGDFTGGAMNLVLRSGQNDFHGTAFINYLNDGLVGTRIGNLNTRVKVPISQTNWGGFLSGPLWKDKLFFAASYETYKTSDATGFGPTGAGFPNAVLNLPQAGFDNVVNIYNTGYASKFNIGNVASTQPVTDKKYSAKIDWNIMDGQRASFTYRYAASSAVQRTDAGVTTLTPTSHWYTQSNKDEAYTFELNSRWTDKLVTNFRATKRSYVNGQNPPSGQNYSDVAVCTAPSADANLVACGAGFSQVRFGPDSFRHANVLSSKELRFNFQAEYTLGSNLLKVGMQARQAKPYNLFLPQSRGVYYFDSIADFQAGRASRLQYANAVTGNPIDAAFATNYWTYSFFFQDALNITDNLKVTAGFRYDWYSYPDKPIFNPNFTARNGFTNQGNIDGKSVVQPRVSAEWRATSHLKINGGFGLFAGGTPDVITGVPFSNTGYATTNIDIQRTATGFTETTGAGGFTPAIGSLALDNLNRDPTFGYTVPANVQALQRGTLTGTPLIPPAAETIAMSPTFKMPGQWKAFLSAKWDFKGWDVGLDGVASKASNEIAYTDTKAQYLIINGQTQVTPDGRIRYDGLPNGTTPGKTSNNAGSNRDLIITNVKNGGRNWVVGVSASKSWDFGGDFAIGYSRSHATDTGPGLRFGTTAGSLYASVPRLGDVNAPAYVDRSVDEIKNRWKMQLGYRHEFFGDNETRLTLFGERQSGRPFGFIMSDSASGRSPVFGVNQTAWQLYVPDFANASGLNAGLVTFATQADFDLFKAYTARFNLKQGQIQRKYQNTNPSINRLDFQISQQFPTIIKGHKIRVVADMRNLLNFIDNDWGVAKEYSDVTSLARVQCADASGAAVAANSAVCARYRYSLVPVTVPYQVNNGLSLWYAQISFRYEF